MKKKLARIIAGSLLCIGIAGAASSALAAANSWQIILRNDTDTGDVPYSIDRPGLDLGPHVMVFDPVSTYPQWRNLTIFKNEVLDSYGFISTSTYNPAVTTINGTLVSLQNQINGLGGGSFNVGAFMANQASTSPYVASSTFNGFMSGSMFTKLSALSTSTATASTNGMMSAADKARFDGMSTSTPSVSYSNRSLNSCFQISATKEAFVAYSVDVDTTISLSGGSNGQVTLRTYSDSGCSTDGQTIQRGKAGLTGTVIVGVAMNNPGSVSLGGVVTRGRYVRLETSNISGTPTYTMVATQEVLGSLLQ